LNGRYLCEQLTHGGFVLMAVEDERSERWTPPGIHDG
jgi:hypothetical protein